MTELYSSPNIIMFYDPTTHMHRCKWLEENVNMDEDIYRQEMQTWADTIAENKASLLYVDSEKFAYTIKPQTQEWIVTELFSKIAQAGGRRMAFKVSEEMIAQLSIEQAVDEDKDQLLQVRYFTTEEEAQEWLKDQAQELSDSSSE